MTILRSWLVQWALKILLKWIAPKLTPQTLLGWVNDAESLYSKDQDAPGNVKNRMRMKKRGYVYNLVKGEATEGGSLNGINLLVEFAVYVYKRLL